MAAFEEGDTCLLIDRQKRRFLLTLTTDRVFSTHAGTIPHSEIIGSEEGQMFQASGGSRYVALRPRLADFILKMKRGAQVVYPKDIGPILMYADIGPGMTVVEAGTGSGALTLALARAVGPSGRVVSVDRRDDHAARGEETIRTWHGGEVPSQIDLRVGEVSDVIAEVGPERIVLDVPEPWTVIETAATHLGGGGVLCAYVPTVPQMQQTILTMRSSGVFTDVGGFEVMHRDWHAEGRSVRPKHAMVGHTGFLVTGRRYLRLDGADTPS